MKKEESNPLASVHTGSKKEVIEAIPTKVDESKTPVVNHLADLHSGNAQNTEHAEKITTAQGKSEKQLIEEHGAVEKKTASGTEDSLNSSSEDEKLGDTPEELPTHLGGIELEGEGDKK